jgi:hypothetical protein
MSDLIVQNVAMFFFGHGAAPVGIIGTVLLPIIFFIIRQWFASRRERNRDGV